MKTIKIASLGEGNKVAYDATNNRHFIPVRFRETVKVGDYMLVINQEFSSRTVMNEDGSVKMNAQNQPVVEACEPWTRSTVTLVGDFKTVTIAKVEPAINEGLEADIIKGAVADLKKEFNLELDAVIA